jgi:hypothetical protein
LSVSFHSCSVSVRVLQTLCSRQLTGWYLYVPAALSVMKGYSILLNGRRVVPQNQCGRRDEQNHSFLRESTPIIRSSSPWCSRYTELNLLRVHKTKLPFFLNSVFIFFLLLLCFSLFWIKARITKLLETLAHVVVSSIFSGEL